VVENTIMLDIETTGIDPACEDLLQIGMVQMVWDEDHWTLGEHGLNLLQFSNRAPVTEFAKMHHKDLYARCNSVVRRHPQELRRDILAFAAQCGLYPPDLKFAGWNASIFDVPFLVAKGVLESSSYRQEDAAEVRTGDFDYHIYDVQSVLQFVKNLWNTASKDKITNLINQLPIQGRHQIPLPDAKDHDALYDCVKQINFLNDLLALIKHLKDAS
jgi:DNA polymerase III epsilon subunit-like protein